MASVRLEHVSKVYDSGVIAVRDLSLDVADKEFVILVGPSGCGKSHPAPPTISETAQVPLRSLSNCPESARQQVSLQPINPLLRNISVHESGFTTPDENMAIFIAVT